jgi:hypothetical protein
VLVEPPVVLNSPIKTTSEEIEQPSPGTLLTASTSTKLLLTAAATINGPTTSVPASTLQRNAMLREEIIVHEDGTETCDTLVRGEKVTLTV